MHWSKDLSIKYPNFRRTTAFLGLNGSPECTPEAHWSKWSSLQPRRSCRRERRLQTRFDLRWRNTSQRLVLMLISILKYKYLIFYVLFKTLYIVYICQILVSKMEWKQIMWINYLKSRPQVMHFHSFIIHHWLFSTDEFGLGISNVFVILVGFLHAAHLWAGWRSSVSTGPDPCRRSQYGGPGCGRCCSLSRSPPARRAASLPPPSRGKLASATWDCGPATGPAGVGWGLGGQMEGKKERRKWCRWEEGEMNEEGGRQKQRGWIRRLIYKHIHAWVIDVHSVLDK